LSFPVRSLTEYSQHSLLLFLTPVDVNRDGFVDVILSKVTGKLLERKIGIFLFIHQQNVRQPFSPRPQQTIMLEGFTPGVAIEDVNGDGKGDLLLSYVRVGLWDIMKNLLSNRVNLVTAIYLLQTDNTYAAEPDFQEKTSYEIDLSDGVRLHGAWPTLGGDFTGDGHKDLLIARDTEIMIYPNTQDGNLFADPLVQSHLPTTPYMYVIDLNGDRKDDLLFYQKEEQGKVSILINEGISANLVPGKQAPLSPQSR
jgi:hypothetical protein